MSEIKLIAVDMDGTLLNDKKEKPADFIPWVKAHPQVMTVIASGRQYETLRRDFVEIEDEIYFMAECGGLVFHQGKMLFAQEIDKDIFRQTLAAVETIPGCVPILCGAKSAYMRHGSAVAEYNADMYYKKLEFVDDLYAPIEEDVMVKIACFFEPKDAGERIGEFVGLDECITTVLSGGEWVDVIKKGVNKGNAIRFLQEKYDISPEECMVFGDYMNDYEMLSVCGESYAMANGHPDLKAIAKHIAPSNEEEGVMQVLRERFA